MSYGRTILERVQNPQLAIQAVVDVVARCDDDALTAAERSMKHFGRLVGAVENGGFDQYFLNGGTAHAHRAARALWRIGCTDAALLLEEAMRTICLPDPVPSNHHYDPTDAQRAALDTLDQRFYEQTETCCVAALAFLRSEVAQFQGAGQQ